MSTIILNWTQAFVSALVPALFALGLLWLRQHQISTTVIAALGRAAGEAYRHIVQTGGCATDPISVAAAIAQGRDYMLERIPDALKAAGVTPDAAAQMVSAELGKLLALDPSVSAGGPVNSKSVAMPVAAISVAKAADLHQPS